MRVRHLATTVSIKFTASSLLHPVFVTNTSCAAAVRMEVPSATRVVLVANVGVIGRQKERMLSAGPARSPCHG